MQGHKFLDKLSIVLLLIGGICWGLVGAFNMEPISAIFNTVNPDGYVVMSPLTRIIYVLIGLSAIYRIILWAKGRK